MSWLIALAIVVLLAVMPLGVSAKYDGDGALVRVIAGPVKIRIFPSDKAKKPKKEKKKPASGAKKEKTSSKTEKKKSGGKWTQFLPLVETALAFLNDFRLRLRVRRLEMTVIMAGDDPCDLAVNYGKAWAALGNLMPRLEEFLVIRRRNLQVECDFEGDVTRIFARVDATITLGALVYLLLRYGLRALKQFMNIKKGGAEK